MMTKSRFGYACVIAMLAVSPAAFSEIIDDVYRAEDTYGLGSVGRIGDGYGGHYASGYADGDDPWGVGVGEGSKSYYTTEAGDFEWWYFVRVYGSADLSLSTYFQACYAWGEADASASAPNDWDSLSADAFVQSTDFQGEYWLSDEDNGGFPNGIYVSYYGPYEAYDGVYASHRAAASAGVIEDSDETGSAYGYARADCDWYDYWP